jgi:hypothetical protein
MRRITFGIVSTIAALVLLFSYRTSRGPAETATAAPVKGGDATVVSGDGAQAPAGPDPTGAVTVDGAAVQTKEGPVQVQVKISGGRIVDVVALQKPGGEQRHEEVSAFSLPKLRAQALAAQSAELDGVSGATATSGGYRQSLQSALDAADFS